MMELMLFLTGCTGLLGPCAGPDETPSVLARQLVDAFYGNQAAVEEYYLEKKVILSGTVQRITRDHESYTADLPKGSYYAMEMDLGNVREKTGLTLVLVFDQAHRKQLAALRTGEYVTVSGICKRWGRSATIEVVDCKLIVSK